MTYKETVLRIVRLMFVAHQKRWIDISLCNLTDNWLRHVEERFAGVNDMGKSLLFFKIFPLLMILFPSSTPSSCR